VIGCHIHCERHAAWKVEHEKAKEKHQEQLRALDIVCRETYRMQRRRKH
jgi:hypothetical protein